MYKVRLPELAFPLYISYLEVLFTLCNMSTVASIESGILAPDLREALRTLLSRSLSRTLSFPALRMH